MASFSTSPDASDGPPVEWTIRYQAMVNLYCTKPFPDPYIDGFVTRASIFDTLRGKNFEVLPPKMISIPSPTDPSKRVQIDSNHRQVHLCERLHKYNFPDMLEPQKQKSEEAIPSLRSLVKELLGALESECPETDVVTISASGILHLHRHILEKKKIFAGPNRLLDLFRKTYAFLTFGKLGLLSRLRSNTVKTGSKRKLEAIEQEEQVAAEKLRYINFKECPYVPNKLADPPKYLYQRHEPPATLNFVFRGDQNSKITITTRLRSDSGEYRRVEIQWNGMNTGPEKAGEPYTQVLVAEDMSAPQWVQRLAELFPPYPPKYFADLQSKLHSGLKLWCIEIEYNNRSNHVAGKPMSAIHQMIEDSLSQQAGYAHILIVAFEVNHMLKHMSTDFKWQYENNSNLEAGSGAVVKVGKVSRDSGSSLFVE